MLKIKVNKLELFIKKVNTKTFIKTLKAFTVDCLLELLKDYV